MEVALSSQLVVRARETLHPGRWLTVPLPDDHPPAPSGPVSPAPTAQAPLAPPRGPAPDTRVFEAREAARLRRLGTVWARGMGLGPGRALLFVGSVTSGAWAYRGHRAPARDRVGSAPPPACLRGAMGA